TCAIVNFSGGVVVTARYDGHAPATISIIASAIASETSSRRRSFSPNKKVSHPRETDGSPLRLCSAIP
ncbi:MAG: hypothetical protein ABI182_07220, partial [Candidatus Baltobacteraceae bacterium]